MRLRLIIERHLLPPVKVVWTVGRVLPPLANAGASYTISQLLEQINQTIPLQSDQWNLEDYVVETGGFECLHFSQIGDALNSDAEVRIRPLQRADLRDRKLSGRHQTTADGRHLIDRVTFGRRSSSAEARPTVEIPPRKKKRIEQDQHDDSHTLSGDEQIILRPSSENEDCHRRTINERYRLAKVSAEDERLGLFALDDGRGPSPDSATFSDGSVSVDEDDQTLSTPSSADGSREASPASTMGLNLGNWVRPIDDDFEPSDPMTIHQLHFGDSDDSGSSNKDYESNDKSTDVCSIGNSENIPETSHYSEDQDSESAENHSFSLEDDAQYTNSSRVEDSDEEIGIPTNIHDPYFAELDDDDYSADAELDPTKESIHESEGDIESASEDMNCSSDDDSDATKQRDVDHTNIQDPINMGIRDLFHSDFEVDYTSDEDFDAAAETANDSEESMEDSDNSKDADSDYTDDSNDFTMTILGLVRRGDIDDRSSDEGDEPTDEGTDDDRDDSESDKENSEQNIWVSGSSPPESDGKQRSDSSPLPAPLNNASVTFKLNCHNTKAEWGALASGQLHQVTEAVAPSSSVTLGGNPTTI